MKSITRFNSVACAVLIWSCYVDTTLPSTPATDLSVDISDTVDVGFAPSGNGGFETGGILSESVAKKSGPDAQIATDSMSSEGIVNIQSNDAAATDTVSEEEFGLSCDGVLCPSVTSPARQCCTEQEDVEVRRAQTAGRCGIARLTTEGCTELEQMGALDISCPSFQPRGALTEEPGCCTVQGRCGTFDVANGIGCHENESIDQACGKENIDETRFCEPTGIYAVKAEIDLAWGGQTGLLFDITDDGRGIATVALKFTVESFNADHSFVAKVKPCGVELPYISNSLICEAYLPSFPNEIWDGGTMPTILVPGAFTCMRPGCVWSVGPSTGSFGIELEDEGSIWPTAEEATTFACPAGTGKDCYPDHDGDGYPGITVTLPYGVIPPSEDCPYGYQTKGAPLSADLSIILNSVYRTDRLHLGVRLRLGASGKLSDDCEVADAAGMTEFVQSRTIGCMLEPGTANLFAPLAGNNDPCNDEQLLFMNRNLPIYDILRLGDLPDPNLNLPEEKRVPSVGPRFQLIRLSDFDEDVSCQQVREAF